MKLIETKNLSHKFAKYDENGDKCGYFEALRDVSISVSEGSFIAVLGRNGSGKSTLSKHLNALYLPTEGTVLISGMDTGLSQNLLKIRQEIGMVFQNPDNQIVTSIIEEDVAFGPENLGVEQPELERRVSDSLEKVGMTSYRFHSPNKLSGGQKQRIAIASVLAMKPKCIILDESTAMLDPAGRREVIDAVKTLNKEENITIILITHYMEETVDADRIILMDKGKICKEGSPLDIFSDYDLISRLGLTLPDVTLLGKNLRDNGIPVKFPVLHEAELTDELIRLIHGAEHITREIYNEPIEEKKNTVIEFKNVSFTYSQGTQMEISACKNISFEIAGGCFYGIAGHTGSGKSTLLQLAAGLLKPTEGNIYINGIDIWEKTSVKSKKSFFKKKDKPRCNRELTGKIGLVFQYPEHQLFGETVLSDVSFGPLNKGFDKKTSEEKARAALKLTGISESLYLQSPFTLSGGQKRRAAIAGILAMEPEILILDEPTAGLDPAGRREILDLLSRLNTTKNMTVILVSHSMEDLAAYTERLLIMDLGELILNGKTSDIFKQRQRLEKIGLGVPAVCRIIDSLRAAGIDCAHAYTLETASKSICEAYEKNRGGQL